MESIDGFVQIGEKRVGTVEVSGGSDKVMGKFGIYSPILDSVFLSKVGRFLGDLNVIS